MAEEWVAPPSGATATWTRTITQRDVETYAEITGDRNPLHFDEDFARQTRFGRLVVQGGITAGLFNALVAMALPGPGSVFLHQEWDYPAPVYPGDTITAEAKVIEARSDKPITKLACVARNQDGVEVLRGECLVYTMVAGVLVSPRTNRKIVSGAQRSRIRGLSPDATLPEPLGEQFRLSLGGDEKGRREGSLFRTGHFCRVPFSLF